MSSIITVIESVVADLTPEPEFIYGFKSWANLKADEKKFPIVILVEPITSDDTFHQGGLVDSSYPIFMLFLDRTELADTPEQHRVAVDAMRDLRRQFILRLKKKANANGEHIFKSIDNVGTTDTFNELDANASGVGVNFTATPLNSDSVCVS
jgi:hypothetical protein